MNVYLDTHVLVWLFEGKVENLSAVACRAIEENDVLASPAAVLELEYLHEIGRLRPTAVKVTTELGESLGLRICELPFRKVVDFALKESWGRDPFDRLIVANAKASGSPLLTKDEKIHQHYSNALW